MDSLNWPLPTFDELYIHESVWDSPVAKRVRTLLPMKAISVESKPYEDRDGELSGFEFSRSKQRLYLSRHDGHFFRKCPGTHGAACCNYFVLNLGVQCTMNCSYCYLQSYINSPLSQIYVNIDDALNELGEIAERNPKSPFRVGTGETIDSLVTDDLTLYSARLVEWFKDYPHLTCEFKTKSCNIKNFVDLPHGGNVVVSFSINPEEIVKSEEHGTATLGQRLFAARLAADRGFPVSFHIDPMIFVPDWKTYYGRLVEQVSELFKPSEVKWISLGALRFPPSMKSILRERFGAKSVSLTGEMFPSDDGKLRYDLGLRTQMFDYVLKAFLARDRKYPVFLCMESPESWIGTFGATPRKVEGIEGLFSPMPTLGI